VTASPVRPRQHVVVIGAGFAGLSAALHLAAAGADVTVLERLGAPGGKAGEWREGGFRFDTGPTVFTLPEVAEATFAAAGRPCPLDFAPDVQGTRYVFPSGRVWDVSHDLDRTVAALSPQEADTYVRVLRRARSLYEAAAPVFVHAPAPNAARLLRYALRHGLAAAPGRTLPRLLDALGVRGDLLPLFLRFATYVGADPFRAPAVLLNVAWVELGLGTRSVGGGMHALAMALAATAADLGVTLRYGVAARRVVRRGGVREVHHDDGVLRCDAVVLAVDRRHAAALLGERARSERTPSLSGLVVLAGVRGVDERLAQHTIFFPEAYGREFEEIRAGVHPRDPTLYVSISARRHPADAPPGHDNLFVMANAPALPSRGRDGETDAHAQGQRSLREAMARRALARDDDVVVERWITPSTLAAFGHRGSLYGDAPHGLLAALRPRQVLPGDAATVFAGGTVHPGGGVPLALLSGRHAAAHVQRVLGLHRRRRRP
jgi:phytoene desaturase